MPLRLLLVEDSADRVARFQAWCPADMRLVVSRRAGAAIGLVTRDPAGTYAGLMLDHDLVGDGATNGTDVARAVAQHLRPPVPVLVHTNSASGAAAMGRVLAAAGFEVTRIAFEELAEATFAQWIEGVREDAEG